MFAPPPVQLSREEIQQKIQARKSSLENSDSLARTASAGSDSKTTSLHRNDSRSPTSRRNIFFGKHEKIKVSAPIVTSPSSALSEPPGLRAELPKARSTEGKALNALPPGFGENPRRAPVPPKRPPPPPSDSFSPHIPGAYPSPHLTVPGPPTQESPPPIPEKSPRRQKLTASHVETTTAPPQRSLPEIPLNVIGNRFNISLDVDVPVHERPIHPLRSHTAPALALLDDLAPMAKSINVRTRSTKSAHAGPLNINVKPVVDSKTEARLSGVKSGKVEKHLPSARRVSNTASIRSALHEIDDSWLFSRPSTPPRRATEGDLQTVRSSTPPEFALPWKRRRKGETMSMLLERGFFQAGASEESEEDSSKSKDDSTVGIKVKVPPPLNIINKELPATPDSITATPTEMYSAILKQPQPVKTRRLGGKKRSPLGQVPSTDAKANISPTIFNYCEDLTIGGLSAIPEHSAISEKSPTSSGMTTPVATQIHLRGGSVVTVSPPELTAWHRTVYIQGPIKLPKPSIVPRKNSVASLEAFQEAVDQVYQDALSIPRRRSDDAVAGDICDFFDEFEFDEVSYGGDVLATEGMRLDEINEDDEDPACEVDQFGTPCEESASPVEKIVAKEIAETLPSSSVALKIALPPVENEETLRARGIARRAHGSGSHLPLSPTLPSPRKDSTTLARQDNSVLPLLPLPEESMLESVLAASQTAKDANMRNQQVGQAVGASEDVEEMDGDSDWVAPATAPKGKYGLNRKPSGKESVNPMKRMRKLMATASAIL